MTATYDQIVWHFIHMPDYSGNWGTSVDNSKWDVDEDTYINGITLHVDLDYYQGYLIEVAERDSGVVSYVAIVTFHGPHPETGDQDHDSIMFDGPVGTFGDRILHPDGPWLRRWGLDRIHGLLEAKQDRINATKEK